MNYTSPFKGWPYQAWTKRADIQPWLASGSRRESSQRTGGSDDN